MRYKNRNSQKMCVPSPGGSIKILNRLTLPANHPLRQESSRKANIYFEIGILGGVSFSLLLIFCQFIAYFEKNLPNICKNSKTALNRLMLTKEICIFLKLRHSRSENRSRYFHNIKDTINLILSIVIR
jgi:hypothetical protein